MGTKGKLTANQKIINSLTQSENVLQSNAFGNGHSIVFEVDGKTFSVVTHGSKGFNVYQCYLDGGDYTFLPNGKEGKTLRTINNFIAAKV